MNGGKDAYVTGRALLLHLDVNVKKEKESG
jgi:hypothetical protein